MTPTSPVAHATPPSADRRLWENQGRLRQLIHAADGGPGGLWAWDLVTNAVYFSPEWKQQLGYADRELPNLFEEWDRRLHPEDRERTLATVRDYRAGLRAFYDMEFRMRHRDGSWRWIFARADFLRDSTGQPVRMLGYHFDITERKQAEEAQAEALGRLQKIAESIPGVVYQYRLRPDGTASFPYASEGCREMYGVGPEEVREDATKIFARHHPDDLPGLVASIEKSARDLTPWRHEARLIADDGAVRWLEANSLPEREADGSILWHGYIADVTERKLAEDALRNLSHRLVQAGDAERRRIARELHDSTAQDLAAVLMNLALLQDHLGKSNDLVASQIIADSAALLENSIHELRTLAYRAHPPRLDDSGLAGALREYASGFSQRTGIRVAVEMADAFPRLPEPLEMALFRVVQESLANVLRHSGSATALLRLATTGGAVTLEIADQGCGFALDARPPAPGVGIPGMRERLQYCGGRLEVASGSAGTTVRAVLPVPEGGA